MLVPLLNGSTREFIPGPGRGFTATEPRVGTVLMVCGDYLCIRTSLGTGDNIWEIQVGRIKTGRIQGLGGTLDKEDYVHEF